MQVWMMKGTVRHECNWACAAQQLPGATIVVPRFGSSDCRCASHLFGFADSAQLPSLHIFTALIGERPING